MPFIILILVLLLSGCLGSLAKLSQNLNDGDAVGSIWEDHIRDISPQTLQKELDSLRRYRLTFSNPNSPQLAAETYLRLQEDQWRMEQLQAWLNNATDKAKYGHPSIKLGSMDPAMLVDMPSPATFNYQLPPGKIALVSFNLNRQIKALHLKDSTAGRVGPSTVQTDTNVFWTPWNSCINILWEQMKLSDPPIIPKQAMDNLSITQSDSTYQIEGAYVPPTLLGMQAPFDEVMPPGFRYFNPYLKDRLAKVAQALKVDYTMILRYSATYASFGKTGHRNLGHLMLTLELSIHDKNGHFVEERRYSWLSKTKTMIFANELYPPAIPFLVQEAHEGVLRLVQNASAGLL